MSRKFYAKLGDEVANELVNWFNAVDATYRADLQQLNEASWARFDARLEQRLAEVKADLRTEMREGFAGVYRAMGELRTESAREIAGLKVELIRWMFGFWIGNLFATAGMVFAALKLSR